MLSFADCESESGEWVLVEGEVGVFGWLFLVGVDEVGVVWSLSEDWSVSVEDSRF